VFTELAGRKDAAFLGLRGLYQGAVARGDWDAANALARQAADINPDAPWLRTERERLAIRSGSWTEALQLAGRGTPVAVLATAAAEAEPDPAQARRLAQRAWKADPAFTPAALAYARRLREAGREKRAQAVLRESWTKNPHPALGEASMAVGGFMSRESRAVWLTTDLPDHPESKLLRAHAALDAGNLVEARRYAEAARDGGLEERRVWLLLAGIATREDDAEAASSALRRAANAPPDAHWRCEACGESHEEWHAVCSHCGEAGKITWGSQVGRGATTLAIDSGYAILP
jgi:HemY protein